MAKQQSRATRFTDACSEATSALDTLDEKIEELKAEYANLTAAFENIKEVQEEYIEWKDNLPEGLAESAMGEKLEAIENLDLDIDDEFESIDALDELRSKIDEAEQSDFPLGFGRD